MSSPPSSFDNVPTAGVKAEPSVEDGWRTGGLTALRAELDRIDNAVHDLLMQRAAVVEHVARSGKPAAFRPGREAAIIRRLLARHRGALPPVALTRIWRELLAGTTSMQGGFSFVVHEPKPSPDAPLTQLAREHFGALTPMCSCGSAGSALREVAEQRAAVAIMPYPSGLDDWWPALLRHEPRLYIIARLPFWQPRPPGFSRAQAVVVATTPPDPSGDDRSWLAAECDPDVDEACLRDALTAVDLHPMTVMHAPHRACALVEVNGYLSGDDRRIHNLGPVLRRPVMLGGYAVPYAGGSR